MASLASLTELKDSMSIPDEDSDAALERALAAASRWIESHCGRTFGVSTSDLTKTYYPSEPDTVEVVDLVTVTSVKTDSHGDRTFNTTLATTDYELLPLWGPPYHRLRMWPTSSKSFGPGRLVQIVGTFGYTEGGAVPQGVVQACLLLAARFFSRREAPFGILQSTDLGQFTRLSANDPDVLSLLAPYRLTSQWVLV